MSYGLQVFNSSNQLDIDVSSSLTRLFGVYTANCSLYTVTTAIVGGTSTHYASRAVFNIPGISAIPTLGVILIDQPGHYTRSGDTITAYSAENIGQSSPTDIYLISSTLTIAVLFL